MTLGQLTQTTKRLIWITDASHTTNFSKAFLPMNHRKLLTNLTELSGADIDSIIRCRHWSSIIQGREDASESKFVFEILCIKKQQKFKFVFEKMSSSDPFQPMHQSLSAKVATMQQKGTGIGTPMKESAEVRASKPIILNCVLMEMNPCLCQIIGRCSD